MGLEDLLSDGLSALTGKKDDKDGKDGKGEKTEGKGGKGALLEAAVEGVKKLASDPKAQQVVKDVISNFTDKKKS